MRTTTTNTSQNSTAPVITGASGLILGLISILLLSEAGGP